VLTLKMFALIILDHRLAFVFLCALVVGAGIPLAAAWARVLPEDAPLFASRDHPSRSEGEELLKGEARTKESDPFSVVLLVFVTLSYALRFPGFPMDAALHLLSARVPGPWLYWGLLVGRAFFVVTPGLAACYAVVRPSLLRVPLMCSGILVLLLWLLEPVLFAAMIAS
jgi:hypothetical protein